LRREGVKKVVKVIGSEGGQGGEEERTTLLRLWDGNWEERGEGRGKNRRFQDGLERVLYIGWTKGGSERELSSYFIRTNGEKEQWWNSEGSGKCT